MRISPSLGKAFFYGEIVLYWMPLTFLLYQTWRAAPGISWTLLPNPMLHAWAAPVNVWLDVGLLLSVGACWVSISRYARSGCLGKVRGAWLLVMLTLLAPVWTAANVWEFFLSERPIKDEFFDVSPAGIYVAAAWSLLFIPMFLRIFPRFGSRS